MSNERISPHTQMSFFDSNNVESTVQTNEPLLVTSHLVPLWVEEEQVT